MTALIKTYGPVQLARKLGLPQWQFTRARAMGLVPRPDVPGGRWSARVAAGVAAGRDYILDRVGDTPDAGAVQAAQILSHRTGVEVTPEQVAALAEAGHLRDVGGYPERRVYCGRSLAALADREVLRAALAGVLVAAGARGRGATDG